MAKLKVLSGNEVCRILASQGFVEVRRRSSHVVMQKVISDSTVTVPVSGDYMEPVQYIAARREIVWLNFEPARGKEIG